MEVNKKTLIFGPDFGVSRFAWGKIRSSLRHRHRLTFTLRSTSSVVLPTNLLQALGFSSRKISRFLKLTLISHKVMFYSIDWSPNTSLTSTSLPFEQSMKRAQAPVEIRLSAMHYWPRIASILTWKLGMRSERSVFTPLTLHSSFSSLAYWVSSEVLISPHFLSLCFLLCVQWI